MDLIHILALVAFLALVAWLVLTWWNTPAHVTFKVVVQSALRDVVDIFAPPQVRCAVSRAWRFLGPRLTNMPVLAVILLDVYAILAPELRDVIASDWRGAGALLVLNLFARLSPRDAPSRIPPPPAGGPGAETERAQAHAQAPA